MNNYTADSKKTSFLNSFDLSELKYTRNIPILEQVRAQVEPETYEKDTRTIPERA